MSVQLAIDVAVIIDVTLQYDVCSKRWYAHSIENNIENVRGNCITSRGNGNTIEEALNAIADNYRFEYNRKYIAP